MTPSSYPAPENQLDLRRGTELGRNDNSDMQSISSYSSVVLDHDWLIIEKDCTYFGVISRHRLNRLKKNFHAETDSSFFFFSFFFVICTNGECNTLHLLSLTPGMFWMHDKTNIGFCTKWRMTILERNIHLCVWPWRITSCSIILNNIRNNFSLARFLLRQLRHF